MIGATVVCLVAYRNRDVLFAWARNCWMFLSATANNVKRLFSQAKMNYSLRLAIDTEDARGIFKALVRHF